MTAIQQPGDVRNHIDSYACISMADPGGANPGMVPPSSLEMDFGPHPAKK